MNHRFIAVSEPLVFLFFLRCTQILSLIFDQFHLMKLLFLEMNLIRRGLNTRCATSEPRWRLISSFFIFSSQQLSFNFLSECFLFQSTAISTRITLARLGCWRSCETRVCLTNSRSSRRVVCVTFKWDPAVTHLSFSLFVPANFIPDGAHSTRQTLRSPDGFFHLRAAQIISYSPCRYIQPEILAAITEKVPDT